MTLGLRKSIKVSWHWPGDGGRGGKLWGQHSGQRNSLSKGLKVCTAWLSLKPGAPGLKGLEMP